MFWAIILLIGGIVGVLYEYRRGDHKPIFLVALIFPVAVFGLWYSGDATSKSEHVAMKGGIDSTKSELRKMRDDLKRILMEVPPDIDTIAYPGFSIIMGLVIKKNLSTRRAFIYDYGNSRYKDRVSIYLNQSNELVFRIFDLLGDPYTVLIQQGKGEFELDRAMFLAFEYGENADSSFIRVLVNASEVGRANLGKRLELSITKTKVGDFILGADQELDRCSNLLLGIVTKSRVTFTPEMLSNMQNNFYTLAVSVNQPYMAVGCTNILRPLDNGDLVSVWDNNQVIPNIIK